MGIGVIIALIVVLLIVIVAVALNMGGKPAVTGSTGAPAISSSAGGAPPMDIESQMKEEASDELVTKYTEGTGEGIQEVEKLLESDPENIDLLDWLAFMYYSNSQIDKAIETYKRVLKLNPNNENQHYYLANSFYKKGNYQDALKEWKEVIRLKPTSKIAKNSQQRIDAIAAKV